MVGTGSGYSDDPSLVVALREGDEGAFEWLLGRYDSSLRRLARTYVATDAIADEVVQDTWMGVIRGIDGFQQRSSVKTWLYRILLNVARTKGVREHRSIPFSSAVGAFSEAAEPTFDPDRFRAAGPGEQYPGHWVSFPPAWEAEPESMLLSREVAAIARAAIARLPDAQREVLTLRDVEGWTAVEVCNALELSETNQRVLLHRARSRVRRALEVYFEGAMAT